MVNFLNFEIGNITIAEIENLLAKYPNFNISDMIIQINPNGTEFKTTLAQYVLFKNNEEVLDYLINSNVDLNVHVPGFGTALHLVASWGNLKMVEKLLQAGANVNAQLNKNFVTPLIEAVTHGHFDVAKCLIENGADIHAITTRKKNWGHTAVLIATTYGRDDIAEMLVKNGADPCAQIELSNLNVAGVENILSTTPNININSIFICKPQYHGCPTTLAHLAIEYKNEELLDYVINSKADLNISIPHQGTVLEVAAKMGNLNLVKKLCESGADVNLPTFEWSTPPLIHAAKEGFFDVVKYLIEKGADVNAVTTESGFESFNALIFAADRGFINIAELLLKNNANPNTPSKSEFTPIVFACRHDHFEIIEMLLAYGAIYDSSIFVVTVLNKSVEILEYLLTLDLDTINTYMTNKKLVDPVLHYFLINSMRRIRTNLVIQNLEVLLDAGVEINSVNKNNQLAVEVAEDSELLDYVKRHIVKLKQAGIYVCHKNIKTVENQFDDFHIECLSEVEKLKNDKISTSNLVFFEVLHKSFHSLAIRLKYTNIDSIVDKDKLLNLYPIYGGIIYYKLAKTQRRIKLVERVEEFLDYVLNYCLKLPHTFIREVYLYLTNENLKKIIQ